MYPAIPSHKKLINRDDEKINILFVGRDFHIKGGEIALQIMDNLTKKYPNVESVFISETPIEQIKKYKTNKKIKFMGLMPQKELFQNIFSKSHILLYPTFSDTFGFSIIEAQSFGIPVIAQKTKSTHTIEETISEGKTGFIIENLMASAANQTFDEDLIKRMTLQTERLIKDNKLRRQMSSNCINEIERGKFSIDKRKVQVKRIYLEAIK